jgi:hypothetical protein
MARPGIAMTGTSRGSASPTPVLPSKTLTQASVSLLYSWARPPPSTRTWLTPGRARPSPPPGSMALAGEPGTHSPGRPRLRSWPRGSAHAQLLRPVGGTHRRTPAARGQQAVPRTGCGVRQAAAGAKLQKPPSRSPAPALPPPSALNSPQHLPQLSGVVV